VLALGLAAEKALKARQVLEYPSLQVTQSLLREALMVTQVLISGLLLSLLKLRPSHLFDVVRVDILILALAKVGIIGSCSLVGASEVFDALGAALSGADVCIGLVQAELFLLCEETTVNSTLTGEAPTVLQLLKELIRVHVVGLSKLLQALDLNRIELSVRVEWSLVCAELLVIEEILIQLLNVSTCFSVHVELVGLQALVTQVLLPLRSLGLLLLDGACLIAI
jgi:hypothetical protein